MEEPRFSRRTALFWGTLVGVLGLVSVIVPPLTSLIWPHMHGSVYDPPEPITDFSLARADGGTLDFAETRGTVVLVYFGYTNCPDICPSSLYDLRRTIDELGDRADEVTVLFVTIDPDNDTPEKMADYLRYFNPTFIGLTGSHDELQQVYDAFQIQILEPSETISGYGLGHSGAIYLLDRKGNLRLRLHYGTPPKDIARDIRFYLREKA
jgi:protein SCO1/2